MSKSEVRLLCPAHSRARATKFVLKMLFFHLYSVEVVSGLARYLLLSRRQSRTPARAASRQARHLSDACCFHRDMQIFHYNIYFYFTILM